MQGGLRIFDVEMYVFGIIGIPLYKVIYGSGRIVINNKIIINNISSMT